MQGIFNKLASYAALVGVIKAIEGVKADIKINGAAIEYLDAKIEELKAQQNNPLLN